MNIALVLGKLSTVPIAAQPVLVKIFAHILADITQQHNCTQVSAVTAAVGISRQKLYELCQASTVVALYQQLPIAVLAQPFSLYQDMLYLTKFFAAELQVINTINYLVASQHDHSVDLQQISDLSQQYNFPNNQQLHAIAHTVNYKFSLIAGGPGTGKTTIITLLIWLFYQHYGCNIKIHITALAGKAVARIVQSIQQCLSFCSGFNITLDAVQQFIANKHNVCTIHKLLGAKHNSFQYHPTNQLTLDVLIIDEASMLSLTLLSQLTAALDLTRIKHLILLGDSQQLPAIEGGQIFRDLISQFSNTNFVHQLSNSHRHQPAISAFLAAILAQDPIAALSCTETIKLNECTWAMIGAELFCCGAASLVNYATYLLCNNSTFSMQELFKRLNQYIVLCLTNDGCFGVNRLNEFIDQRYRQLLNITEQWYQGRAIMILQNDYTHNVFNGDIGICRKNTANELEIVFETASALAIADLPKHQLGYALTVDKAQGSEYQHVSVILSATNRAEMLTQARLYTASSRAKYSLTIFSDIETLTFAINNTVTGKTGIANILTGCFHEK